MIYCWSPELAEGLGLSLTESHAFITDANGGSHHHVILCNTDTGLLLTTDCNGAIWKKKKVPAPVKVKWKYCDGLVRQEINRIKQFESQRDFEMANHYRLALFRGLLRAVADGEPLSKEVVNLALTV